MEGIYVKRFVDVVIADYEYIKRSFWNYVWLSNYNFSLPISQLDLPSWKTISFFKVGWTFNYRLETVRGVCKKNGEHLGMRFKIYSGKFAKVLGVYLDKAWGKGVFLEGVQKYLEGWRFLQNLQNYEKYEHLKNV